MNRTIKKCTLITLLLCIQLFVQHASAGNLELFLALRRMYDSNEDKMVYVKPFGNEIKIRQRPMPFYVVVENVSNSSQKMWQTGERNGRAYFSIEFENNEGRKKTIRKKETQTMTAFRAYDMIRPGAQVVEKVLIDPDKWEGFREAEEMMDKDFKARAMYKNGSEKIYSPWYKVNIWRPRTSRLDSVSEKNSKMSGTLSSMERNRD